MLFSTKWTDSSILNDSVGRPSDFSSPSESLQARDQSICAVFLASTASRLYSLLDFTFEISRHHHTLLACNHDSALLSNSSFYNSGQKCNPKKYCVINVCALCDDVCADCIARYSRNMKTSTRMSERQAPTLLTESGLDEHHSQTSQGCN